MKAWIRRHARALMIIGGVGSVVGSVVAWRTWDYIQNDPTFCTSCHLMDDAFDRWSNSPHAEVNCHTCHPGDIKSNLHQLWVTITDDPDRVKKHADVPAEICAGCHLGPEGDWKKVGATAGHALHYNELKIECVECHAPAVHVFIPTDQMCKKCHPTQTVGLSAMQQLHCGKCHDFLAPEAKTLAAGEARCAECHGGDRIGGPAASPWHPELSCGGCHPVHDGAGGTMAAEPVEGPRRGERAVPCVDCHATADALPMPEAHACVACHTPHAAPAGEQGCRDCHDQVAAALPERVHHACVDCHAPHEPDVAAADRCVDCHADPESLATATPVEAHRACDVCHQPHEPGPPDGPACASCHGPEARQVAAGPRAHQQCADCHGIHEPEATRRCGSCHAEERAITRSAPAAHQNCATCHPIHGAPAAGLRPCASCHAKQTKATRAEPPPHQQCDLCHPPHRPEVPPIAACSSCHISVATLVVEEPAKHQDCRSCHAWHRGDLEAKDGTCVGCHADQAPPKRAKIHTDCSACHPVHRTGEPISCGPCHPTQKPEQGASKAHRDCASCHGDTHAVRDAKRRPCNGCHDEIPMAGLHQTPGHDVCLDCHSPHSEARPSAERCTRCHPPERISTHPPAARGVETCHGCHAFGRGE